MSESIFKLEVSPTLPKALAGLQELASDLLYSWDRGVRRLFYRLDYELWESCNHNPKVFLRRVEQAILNRASRDNQFMEEYSRVMSSYKTYHGKKVNHAIVDNLDVKTDRVAYFCAEFGLHESLPIYSGGLGILAGDHCKAASDLGVPFVAMGLLYRQGYFKQLLDGNGNQEAHYSSLDFDDLLVVPATNEQGEEIYVTAPLGGHEVKLKVWYVRVGHIDLYLLDSDLEDNSTEDRSITFQLYGGDKNTRIQQEIVLGIGGTRALRALGIQPTVWHINEGHAAFQVLERCREYVAGGMDFNSALELVAGATVFTTHTPVPAGHDIFEAELVDRYFPEYCKQLGISMTDFHDLGVSPSNHGSFNMTVLALHGSRFHNGVSRIHGGVASQMEGYVWPQVNQTENPISYVTNGVHVPTFLAREWTTLFDARFRQWRNELSNTEYWECIDEIPDHRYWSLRQELKNSMLSFVNKRTIKRFRRSGYSEALIKRITQYTSEPDKNVLVMGFARRFATYKRATLLFSDPERLARLLNDPERPVVLMFAGKAHPADIPGQELIRQIHEISLRPEFIGKIILLEGYDMALARKLVTGVDVWLNTPEYPLEASGTSGQKAAINGVINLSVLDGWWGEGYNGENGWPIYPHTNQENTELSNQEEATDLLDLMENEVIPMYYDLDQQGYSSEWVKMSKASMKSCLPRFNSQRMVVDYVRNFYSKASAQYQRLAENNGQPARDLAAWKNRIHQNWGHVSLQFDKTQQEKIQQGETLPLKLMAGLNGLEPEDVVVECLVGYHDEESGFTVRESQMFRHVGKEGEQSVFELALQPSSGGLNHYKIRMYPGHELLSHKLELGYMIWV